MKRILLIISFLLTLFIAVPSASFAANDDVSPYQKNFKKDRESFKRELFDTKDNCLQGGGVAFMQKNEPEPNETIQKKLRWWYVPLIIVAIMVAVIVISSLLGFAMNKKKTKVTEKLKEEEGKTKKTKTPKHHAKAQGLPEEESQAVSDVEGPQDPDGEDDDKDNPSFVEKVRLFLSPKNKSQKAVEEQITSLNESLMAKDNELNELRDSLASVQHDLDQTKQELDDAKKELEKAKNDLEEAQKELIEARDELTATQEANARTLGELERKHQLEKGSIVADLTQKAEEEANRARMAKTDIEQSWMNDRNAILKKMENNVKHLKEIVEEMSPDAFNGNCKKIRSGVGFYYETLCQRFESEEWQTKMTGECIAALRTECCQILDNGTDSWINLLGRLYSYMSVNELRQQLLMEGLTFELVSDAFITMQAILASMGVVVLNCSPGFDSGNDPVTSSLFTQKTSIDRITSWLNGDAAVQEAVPNHGRTVYDFGQLAYFTSEDLTIHQGSVIYYNS